MFVGVKPSLADLLKHVVPNIAAKWRMVGHALEVERAVMDTVEYDEHKADRCAIELLDLWLHSTAGTGTQPRTWHSVLKAVETVIGRGERDTIVASLQKEPSSFAFDESCQQRVSLCMYLPTTGRHCLVTIDEKCPDIVIH